MPIEAASESCMRYTQFIYKIFDCLCLSGQATDANTSIKMKMVTMRFVVIWADYICENLACTGIGFCKVSTFVCVLAPILIH